jgi:hypothetical protein
LKEFFALAYASSNFVRPALDDDGTDCFLCWPTLNQAIEGKKFQKEHYGMGEVEIVEIISGLIIPTPDIEVATVPSQP